MFSKTASERERLDMEGMFMIMLLYVVLILPTFVVRELLIVGIRGSCLKANGMCMDFTYIESDLHGSSGYDVVAKMIEKLYTDLSRPANLIPTYKTALMFDPGIFLAPIIQFQQVSQKTHFFVFLIGGGEVGSACGLEQIAIFGILFLVGFQLSVDGPMTQG